MLGGTVVRLARWFHVGARGPRRDAWPTSSGHSPSAPSARSSFSHRRAGPRPRLSGPLGAQTVQDVNGRLDVTASKPMDQLRHLQGQGAVAAGQVVKSRLVQGDGDRDDRGAGGQGLPVGDGDDQAGVSELGLECSVRRWCTREGPAAARESRSRVFGRRGGRGPHDRGRVDIRAGTGRCHRRCRSQRVRVPAWVLDPAGGRGLRGQWCSPVATTGGAARAHCVIGSDSRTRVCAAVPCRSLC